MNAPLLIYSFTSPKPQFFADLDLVRTLKPVTTDEGEDVPAGSRGTVVAIYAEVLPTRSSSKGARHH